VTGNTEPGIAWLLILGLSQNMKDVQHGAAWKPPPTYALRVGAGFHARPQYFASSCLCGSRRICFCPVYRLIFLIIADCEKIFKIISLIIY